MTILILGEVSF